MFGEAAYTITDYIVVYFGSLGPYEYIGGYLQKNRKNRYWKNFQPEPVLVGHYTGVRASISSTLRILQDLAEQRIQKVEQCQYKRHQ